MCGKQSVNGEHYILKFVFLPSATQSCENCSVLAEHRRRPFMPIFPRSNRSEAKGFCIFILVKQQNDDGKYKQEIPDVHPYPSMTFVSFKRRERMLRHGAMISNIVSETIALVLSSNNTANLWSCDI